MKFRENWKRFWTLDRHHAAGFTLVELIVVIAIIAILAGVAVPAYSGYITKTNKQADISLVSDIEHALTLAFYRGDFAEGGAGFLLLSPNEGESFVNEDDEGNLGPIAIALENSFGANWLGVMQLKYGSWEVGYTLLSYEDAVAVVNSNFVQKYSSAELMKQVQIMTTAANGLNLQLGDTQVGLYDLFNYSAADGTTQNMVMDVMKEYKIGESTADWNNLSAEEKSNVLVLATASSVSNGTNSLAVTAITDYSLYTAYAAENADFNKAYKAFQEKINDVTPNNADAQYSQIKAAYNELKAAAGEDYDKWKATNNNKTATEQAFKAVMAGVGNAMKDNGDAIIADLGNANMFTDGIGHEMYNDYLSSALATAANGEGIAEVLSAMEYGAIPGAVLVQYAVVDGNLHVANSLPVK